MHLLVVHIGEACIVRPARRDHHVVDRLAQVGEEPIERSGVAGVEGRAVACAELARGALQALGVAGGEDEVRALGTQTVWPRIGGSRVVAAGAVWVVMSLLRQLAIGGPAPTGLCAAPISARSALSATTKISENVGNG